MYIIGGDIVDNGCTSAVAKAEDVTAKSIAIAKINPHNFFINLTSFFPHLYYLI